MQAMPTYVKLAIVIPCLILLITMVAVPTRSSGVNLEITSAPATVHAQIQMTPETPPETCGTCHVKQYQEWKDSWMGRALATPTMVMMQRLYMATAKHADAAYCLRCHSPLMEPLGKTEQILQEVLFGEVKSQSISCTGCHLISELTFDPNDPASVSHNNPNEKFRVSLPKEGEMITFFGPIRGAESPAHKTAYRDFFRRSEMCATCHEYNNSGSGGNTPCCTQYSTWRQSKAAKEGKTCQSCHMPRTPNQPIAVGAPVRKEGTSFHGFHGGRSPEMVAKGARLDVVMKKKGTQAVLTCKVTNLAGHNFPDGCPYANELKLFVTVVDEKGNKVFEDLRKYGQEFEDPETGRRPVEEWAAARLVYNNSLRPDETRLETFVFDLPKEAATLTVKVKLENHILSRMPEIKANMLLYGPPGLKETMSTPEMEDYMMRMVADIARPIPVASVEKKVSLR
jgi:hypothetical protein